MRPKKKKFGLIKGLLVIMFATGLTTLAIHASDTFFSGDKSMLAGVGGAGGTSRCPDDMVYINASGGGYCIDRFENSAGSLCENQEPGNQFETTANLARVACVPVSAKNKTPWVSVTQNQAMELCARAGKHLPNNEEWYRAALGTPDRVTKEKSDCALGRTGQVAGDKTGIHDACVSSYGAYDLVGNVWEWVDANVNDGKYNSRDLPAEGYVTDADVGGVAAATGGEPMAPYGGDYWFVNPSGLRGMFRGGFWGIEERAGTYAINATMPASFVGSAVGFRCAK